MILQLSELGDSWERMSGQRPNISQLSCNREHPNYRNLELHKLYNLLGLIIKSDNRNLETTTKRSLIPQNWNVNSEYLKQRSYFLPLFSSEPPDPPSGIVLQTKSPNSLIYQVPEIAPGLRYQVRISRKDKKTGNVYDIEREVEMEVNQVSFAGKTMSRDHLSICISS